MRLTQNRFAALGLLTLGTFACSAIDGAPGKLSLVTATPQFASQDCADGGQKLESGTDNNGNGQLDADEVTATQFVCAGAEGRAGDDDVAGKAGKAGNAGALTGVEVSNEPAGAICPTGGQRIDTGVDADADGNIDAGGITDTVYVCDAAAGASGMTGRGVLVATSDEPASAHCASGGKRFAYGLDANADGTLQAGEIAATRYICNGAPGQAGSSSLFTTSVEPAGAHCAHGGQRIDYGQDENANGVLEPGEVAGSTYTCAGSGGSSAKSNLVSVVIEAPGANCAAGGQNISYGLDDDGNGTLDVGEVDGSRYVCNGVDGTDAALALVAVVVEQPGGNCTGGGHLLTVGLDDNENGLLDPGEVDSTSYVCDFDEFINPSFELPAYVGWTVSSSSSGQWLLVATGTTLHSGDVVFDYADMRNETLTSPGLPYTTSATDGTIVAVQQQSNPGIHRIYQDFTVPLGTTSLSWDMYYKNTWSTFIADSQYIAINVRSPKTDAVIATLYKTAVGDPLVLAGMTPFSVNIAAYAGQDIRFDIETNIQRSWIDVALDHFVLQ